MDTRRDGDATPGGSRLVARDVTLGYGDRAVVADLSTDVPDGQVTVIVGANACGKSTLLRGMARLLRPTRGAVLLDGQAIATAAVAPGGPHARAAAAEPGHARGGHASSTSSAAAGTRTRARSAAGRPRTSRPSPRRSSSPTPSTSPTGSSTSSRAASASGSGSRWRWPSRPTCCCSTSRRRTSTSPTRSRCSTCSPTSTQARGTTIVMVLHDLNLAARYADHLVAMREGRIVAAGPPAEVITEDCVRTVFGMDCRVIEDPVTATPMVIPLGRRSRTPATTGGPHDHDRDRRPPRPASCSPTRRSHAVDAAQPGLRAGRARQPGVRRPRRGRLRHPLQGGPARPHRRAADDPARCPRSTTRPGWARPTSVRSPMRTYTIRDVVRDGDDVRLVVDFVVHEDDRARPSGRRAAGRSRRSPAT